MSNSSDHSEEKPWMSGGPSMYREPEERLPMDLFSYTREAGHCLRERRFLASIAMASTAVELILNRDRRLKALPDFKAGDGWAYLNNRTLRIAREHGLPTDALISAGDDIATRKPIAFVELRNKVAHGEINHLVNTLSDYDSGAEQMAADQELKMRSFVSKWFNTAPDVQDGHIRNNLWPD
ncbi:MAG: hypothetical protein ACRD4A_13525 [Candidatus Acidiferrales bacterium]